MLIKLTQRKKKFKQNTPEKSLNTINREQAQSFTSTMLVLKSFFRGKSSQQVKSGSNAIMVRHHSLRHYTTHLRKLGKILMFIISKLDYFITSIYFEPSSVKCNGPCRTQHIWIRLSQFYYQWLLTSFEKAKFGCQESWFPGWVLTNYQNLLETIQESWFPGRVLTNNQNLF